jgi:hypothetical protein
MFRPSPLVIDWSGSLPERTRELRERLGLLAEEWMLARECGLADDVAYATDLQLEQDGVDAAYRSAVILRIALLRANLDGRNQG